MNQIHAFLSSLYQYSNPEYYLYLWTLPGRKTHLFPVNDLVTMSKLASQLDGDIYFGLGATSRILTDYERPKNEEITAIPGVWVDIDILHSQAHKSKKLPPDIAAALSLLPADLPPSLVVNSGYGIHVYWLFREPWELESAEEQTQATELIRSLQAVVKHNASLKNWEIDTTSDLSRVLRLPGTMNRKLPKTPVLCKIIEQTEVRYNPNDIEELLPAVPEPGNSSRKTAFERRSTDGPASIMLRNCMFMKHCQLNASTLKYDEWLAMLTNIVRASDGIQAAHDISALDTVRYNQKSTDKKINQALQQMNPQTCEYITSTIGFPGCPQGGCGVQSPCGWSLSRVGQARATVRGIPVPTPDTVYVPEVLGALCLLEKDAPQEYDKFYQSCKGKLNLNTLRAEMKKHRQGNLHIVQPGEKRGDRMISGTVKEPPLDLCLPLNFSCTDDGITYVKITSDGTEIKYRAAGAPIIISERVFNVDTQTEKLEIAFKYFKKWRRVLFPRSTIFNSRQIINLADFGVPVSSESAKYLVKWFDALSDINQDRIPVTRSVSRLGWRGDNFIIPTIENKYRIDVDDTNLSSSFNAFKTAGTLELWVKTIRNVTLGRPKLQFIISAAFAGPLLKLLNIDSFLVDIAGISSQGKTSAAQLALSGFGYTAKTGETLIKQANTTMAGIENYCYMMNDLPICLDDTHAISDERLLKKLIYLVANGSGKTRSTASGNNRQTKTWRTVAISTGEAALEDVSSWSGGRARVLTIRNPWGGNCGGDVRKAVEGVLNNYGHAGAEFINWLIKNIDLPIIQENFKKIQRFLTSKCDGNGIAERKSSYFAVVAVAGAMIDKLFNLGWGLGKGIPFLDISDEIIIVGSDKTTGQMGLEVIRDFIFANRNYFEGANEFSPNGEIYGRWNAGKDITVVSMFGSILRKELENRNFNADAVLNELMEKGILHKKQVKLAGGSRRLYCLELASLLGS